MNKTSQAIWTAGCVVGALAVLAFAVCGCTVDQAGCDPRDCVDDCIAAGSATGYCAGGSCQCEEECTTPAGSYRCLWMEAGGDCSATVVDAILAEECGIEVHETGDCDNFVIEDRAPGDPCDVVVVIHGYTDGSGVAEARMFLTISGAGCADACSHEFDLRFY